MNHPHEKGREIKVSLIIPMYYCEEFVSGLLENLCAQRGEDMEILCVIDGSPDGTRALVENYAGQDARIRVLCQEHRGAGAARNLGLQAARGEYVIFPDVDDEYEENYVSRLLEVIEQNDADVAVCQYYINDSRLRLSNKYCGFGCPFHPKGKSIPPESIKGLIHVISHIPHNKIFRRELLVENDLLFSETMSINDLFFSSAALLCARSMVLIEDHLFTYRKHRNPKSISDSRGNNPEDLSIVYRQFYAWLKEKGLWEMCRTDYCMKWRNTLHHYAKYCKGEVLAQSVSRQLALEEPWKDMSDTELLRNTSLYTAQARRVLQKEQARQKKSDLAQKEREASRAQCHFAENEIENISKIRRILRKKYGRNLTGRDDMLAVRSAQVRQAGFIRSLQIVHRKIKRRIL